ncbi:MAG: FCD domain-containing protein [Amylibacter sp.]
MAVDGRGEMALNEHEDIVKAIELRDVEAANRALKKHLSFAFEMRLKIDAGEV